MAAHLLPMTDSDPDYAALTVANFLYGGGSLSSRLGNRVRQQEGLSYGARSVFTADARDKAARFYFYAICNPANIDKVDQVITEELAKLLKDGVTADELAEAKKAFLAQRKTQRASDETLAKQLADALEADRDFRYQSELEKKVAALTLEEVNAAIRKHWQPKKLVIVRAGDFSKK
jgi:zinc protease